MSYIEQSLSPGENIEGVFPLHWVERLPIIMWIILGIPTLGLTLLLAIYEHLCLKHIELGLTNKRMVFKTGIISRRTQELNLDAIETLSINQGIVGRVFNFGTVTATGRGNSFVIFKGIKDPLQVKRQIEKTLRIGGTE